MALHFVMKLQWVSTFGLEKDMLDQSISGISNAMILSFSYQ